MSIEINTESNMILSELKQEDMKLEEEINK